MRTTLKLQAGEHTVKVRDWGWSDDTPHRVDLHLDGHCLVVTDKGNLKMVEAIAREIVYALKAPERKKGRRRVDRAVPAA